MSHHRLPVLSSSPLFALALILGACDPHPPLNEGGGDDGSDIQSKTPDDSDDPSSSNNETETGSDENENENSGDNDDDSSPSESNEESETGESTDEDTDEETGDEDATFNIEARMKLVDDTGEAVPGCSALFCGPIVDGMIGICIPGTTDDEGIALFSKNLQPGAWSAKFMPGVNFPDKKYAGNAIQVELEEGKTKDAGMALMPEVESLISLNPEDTELQELVVSDTLTLKVAPSDIFFLSSANHDVGAVQVDKKFWPTTELEGGEVLGMWAFSVFGNYSKEDKFIDFELEDSLGLEPDSKVNIYELDKEIAEFKKASEGQVNSDGQSISPKEGKGLHYLTWMAITAPKD